jgi:hypothetical protein
MDRPLLRYMDGLRLEDYLPSAYRRNKAFQKWRPILKIDLCRREGEIIKLKSRVSSLGGADSRDHG